VTGRGAPADSWALGGSYESYVGRWSRLVAQEFLSRLAVPARSRWLDVGCGTGALTQTVLDRAEPAAVVGVDPSPGFLAHASLRTSDAKAWFAVADAQHLPVGDSTCDAVVSGLVLNFVPDKAAALSEMHRVVRPGATVAAYVWDYAGEMQLMRWFWDPAAELDPAARPLHEGTRFGGCRPDALRTLFAGAGLTDVTVDAVVVPTVFAGFDEYWSPFLGGQGPAPSYAMSLDEHRREALREALRARLPTEDDGTIRLTASAWAVRARR
jgi:SAM-dependent methyltransferase